MDIEDAAPRPASRIPSPATLVRGKAANGATCPDAAFGLSEATKRDGTPLMGQLADAGRRFAVAVEAVEQRHEVGEQQRRDHPSDDRDGERLL